MYNGDRSGIPVTSIRWMVISTLKLCRLFTERTTAAEDIQESEANDKISCSQHNSLWQRDSTQGVGDEGQVRKWWPKNSFEVLYVVFFASIFEQAIKILYKTHTSFGMTVKTPEFRGATFYQARNQ